MHIVVDIRCLMDGHMSGVRTYTMETLSGMLQELSSQDHLTLWYNCSKDISTSMAERLAHLVAHPQVTLHPTRTSNKAFLLHCLLPQQKDFFQWLDSQAPLSSPPDILWMPDLRPILPSVIPRVLTVHDMSYYDYSKGYGLRTRVWHQLLRPRQLIHTAQQVIAVSQFTKQRIMHHVPSAAAQVEVIYEGATTHPATPPLPTPKGPFFVTLSTIEPRKNLPFTIQEFIRWNEKQSSPYTLYVLGGAMERIFRRESLPKDPHVHYTGVVSESHKSWYLAHARALLYLSHYEGFGLPVVEAASLGTPAIVADGSALSEVAGKGALVIRSTDAEAYHGALTALTKEDTYKNLGHIAKVRSSLFTWEACAERTWSLFRRML